MFATIASHDTFTLCNIAFDQNFETLITFINFLSYSYILVRAVGNSNFVHELLRDDDDDDEGDENRPMFL